jgi:hypothetical protein
MRVGHGDVLTHIRLAVTADGNGRAMSDLPTVWPNIPMPTLLCDESPSRSNRDPETSGDAGPVYSEADTAAARSDVDEPLGDYARQLWRALDGAVRYLRDDVARGNRGGTSADQMPLLRTEEQWQAWMALCAAVLSTLAGPAGDEGYGVQEARLECQNNFRFRSE